MFVRLLHLISPLMACNTIVLSRTSYGNVSLKRERTRTVRSADSDARLVPGFLVHRAKYFFRVSGLLHWNS
jgi:hypothetical protein